MKKFFIIVIAVTLCAIIGYGIAYFVGPVRTMKLEEYTHEVTLKCNDAFIVRDEAVNYATAAGIVYNMAEDGERVANSSVIAEIYRSGSDLSVLSELRTIDKRISLLKKLSAGGDSYEIGTESAENEVSKRMNGVIELSKENSVEVLRQYREDINGYRSGAPTSESDTISVLEAQRSAAELHVSEGKRDMLSNRSGIFSSTVDGLEAVLAPDRIADYDPQYIRSLSVQDMSRGDMAAVVVGDPVCKVMNNHEWYVLGIVGADKAAMCTEGASVGLRFPSISASNTTGTITYVSQADENGDRLFLVRVPTYVESAFSYRKLEAEIIFESYSGYRIPTHAIHTREGVNEYYVNAMKGSDTFKCDCEVLYSDAEGEYSIIRSTENAEYKLGSMERLVVGEK